MLEFTMEVDVALARPPRADATVFVRVAVPDMGAADPTFSRAEAHARQIAGEIASANPRVVMPVAVRVMEAVL